VRGIWVAGGAHGEIRADDFLLRRQTPYPAEITGAPEISFILKHFLGNPKPFVAYCGKKLHNPFGVRA
jgi:hypothetical protein